MDDEFLETIVSLIKKGCSVEIKLPINEKIEDEYGSLYMNFDKWKLNCLTADSDYSRGHSVYVEYLPVRLRCKNEEMQGKIIIKKPNGK